MPLLGENLRGADGRPRSTVIVILLLLTGYFQLLRLALAVVLTIPAVLLGCPCSLGEERYVLEHSVFYGIDHGGRRRRR